MEWVIGIIVLWFFAKNYLGKIQGNQYINSTQPVATPVQPAQDFCCSPLTGAAPIGPNVVAQAGACAPINNQCFNPTTPQTPNKTVKAPVPTGVFVTDNGSLATVATSDAVSVQWYNTNDDMIGQTPVQDNGTAGFSYLLGTQIDRAVLIGPGGSTIILNHLAAPLPQLALQPSPGSSGLMSVGIFPIPNSPAQRAPRVLLPAINTGVAFQDKNTPCVPTINKVVPAAPTSTAVVPVMPRPLAHACCCNYIPVFNSSGCIISYRHVRCRC